MWRERLDKTREDTTVWLKVYSKKLKRWLTTPWRIFERVCFYIGLIVMSSLVVAYFMAASFYHALPQVERMQLNDVKVLASKRVENKVVNKRYRHRWVPIKDISRDLLFAIVMSEDATFFEHNGFNFDAMVDSLAENIRERRNASGASTISQQVVKNVFFDGEKSYKRKIREFIITWQMEKKFSKNELLELYLNIAEFGPDIYGVAAASEAFFRKKPIEMNAAEGALLAVLLPSPKRYYYAIVENRNISKQKRKRLERILRDMYYEEFISETDYQRYTRYDYFARIPNRAPATRTGVRPSPSSSPPPPPNWQP